MYEIPTSIFIDGKEFPIRNKGDYRVVLDCFLALEDAEIDKQERLFSSLIIFYDGFNEIEDLQKLPDLETAVKQMYWFFNCGQDISNQRQQHYKLIDWNEDSQLICSAINTVSGTEVRSLDYLHWWTFMGYYMAIKECPLSYIIQIRDKIMKGKKLEKHEREFKLENPQHFIWNNKTVEEAEADRLVRELWNSGV